MAEWQTRRSQKPLAPKGRVGSNPTIGTIQRGACRAALTRGDRARTQRPTRTGHRPLAAFSGHSVKWVIEARRGLAYDGRVPGGPGLHIFEAPIMSKLYVDPETGWPLPVEGGKIVQGYGPENTDPSVKHLYRNGYHPGIDISGVPEGTDVVCPCEGSVSNASVFEGKGNCVIVERGEGLQVLFGHLSRMDVAVGQTVSVGDVLGGVGTTGVSTGVHLHYEYRQNGKDVDPVPFLKGATPTPEGIAAVVRESLNLRSGPSKNDAIMKTLEAGTKVVIGQDGWVPVWYDGRQGWMFAEFLDIAKGK